MTGLRYDRAADVESPGALTASLVTSRPPLASGGVVPAHSLKYCIYIQCGHNAMPTDPTKTKKGRTKKEEQ